MKFAIYIYTFYFIITMYGIWLHKVQFLGYLAVHEVLK